MDFDFISSTYNRSWIGFDNIVLNFFATFSSVSEQLIIAFNL